MDFSLLIKIRGGGWNVWVNFSCETEDPTTDILLTGAYRQSWRLEPWWEKDQQQNRRRSTYVGRPVYYGHVERPPWVELNGGSILDPVDVSRVQLVVNEAVQYGRLTDVCNCVSWLYIKRQFSVRCNKRSRTIIVTDRWYDIIAYFISSTVQFWHTWQQNSETWSFEQPYRTVSLTARLFLSKRRDTRDGSGSVLFTRTNQPTRLTQRRNAAHPPTTHAYAV